MKNTINTTFSINQLSWLYLRTVTKINWIQILFQAFSKIQNYHVKPRNSLHIKFVLSCIINNVVFDKYDISIWLAQVEQVRFQTAGRRLVERTHYMIHWWRTHSGEWPSSRSAGYYKIHKLIRCLFVHYGSIFQMHDPWPGGFMSFFSFTSEILSQS